MTDAPLAPTPKEPAGNGFPARNGRGPPTGERLALDSVAQERGRAVAPLFLLVLLISLPLIWFYERQGPPPSPSAQAILSGVLGLACLLAVLLGRRRRAAWLFVLSYLVGAGLALFQWGGVSGPQLLALAPILPLAALLLGRPGLFLVVPAILSLLGVGVWLEHAGRLPSPPMELPEGLQIAAVATNFVLLAALVAALDSGWVRSVRERLQASRRLAEAARIDAASGLPNAAVLRELLAAPLAPAVPAAGRPGSGGDIPASRRALVLIDLRDLALIHQGLGEAAADAVLREIASRLRSSVRAADPVCRGPAGEFAVLLTEVRDGPESVAAACRLMRVFDRPVAVPGTELAAQGCCGLALDGGQGSGAFLREAQAALAAAREAPGEPIRLYEAGMADKALRSLEIDRDLRRALVAGELRVFYQPIVELQNGELVGFEGLVRWQPPGGPLVPPAEFLGRAEESGFIVEIDRFVLREACLQLARWTRQVPSSRGVYVAVNLSAHDLLAPELARTVADALAESGIAPERLHLEITESSMAGNPPQVQAALKALRELGCVLAVDDFGTGWSSLSYLQQFPVQAIKIDRAFVKTIQAGSGYELAAAVHAMATAMSLGVIAEGIEDRTQYRRLRELGVQWGQGFHFSRPLPPGEAKRFLQPRIPDEPSRAWSRELPGLKEQIGSGGGGGGR